MISDGNETVFPFDDHVNTIGLGRFVQEEAKNLILAKKTFVAVYSSVLLAFGVPGNIITLIVVRRYPMKDKFMSTLMVVECISNTTDLVINLGIYWIYSNFGRDLRLDICTIYLIFFYTNHMMVVWMETLVLACRYFFLQRPEKALEMCSNRRAWILSGLLLGILFVLNVLLVSLLTWVDQSEGKKRECRSESFAMAIAHAVFLFYLPVMLQIELTRRIYVCYRLIDRGSTESQIIVKHAGWQVFKMSLVGTIQFTVTIGPYSVFFHQMYHWYGDTEIEQAKLRLLYTIFLMLVYTNYAINFFIFFFFGQRFRNGCRKLGKQLWNSLMRCLRLHDHQMEISPLPSHTETIDEEGIIRQKLCATYIQLKTEGKLSCGNTTVWSQDQQTSEPQGQENSQLAKLKKDIEEYRQARLHSFQHGNDPAGSFSSQRSSLQQSSLQQSSLQKTNSVNQFSTTSSGKKSHNSKKSDKSHKSDKSNITKIGGALRTAGSNIFSHLKRPSTHVDTK